MAEGERKLISQSAYARRRGVTPAAINKRTVTKGGPIPVHGPKKLIDPKEADSLYYSTMSGAQAKSGNARARISLVAPPGAEDTPDAEAIARAIASGEDPETSPAVKDLPSHAKARIASAVIKAQADRINLEKLKGTLIDRPTALRQAFGYTRKIRDAWGNWPSRIGPILAAQLNVDAHALTVELERHVREHLTELADSDLDL
jgi:hypothetical protein